MAVTKEAIVIVLDIGKSMHCGTEIPSVLEKAKQCISMIIQRKIFSESKDEVALIVFGSKDTENSLAETYDSGYEHIKVVQGFQPASWELLEYVNNIEGSDLSTDFIKENAMLRASTLLQTITGKKFLSRRILFLSCFNENICSDKVDTVCEELNLHKIDLNIIGPVAYQTEDSDEIIQGKASKAEKYVCQILKQVNGESYSFSEALPALIYYQKKKVQAVPWNATIDIGPNLSIPISAYTKVTECKPKSWKNAYSHKPAAKIERNVEFIMNDENQTKVSRENIIPAFKYGTTLVPYSAEDKMNMDYQPGEKGMKVLGFTKAQNAQRYFYSGDKSMYVFGQKNRELSGAILAPFIQALHDTKMVAIVRYVYSARSQPKIGFLSPKIKPDYECLVFIFLPFVDDLRHFMFSPFDNFTPTVDQLDAVDNLITSMDLTADKEEEFLKPKHTVNPYLQRLYQCLQYKAFHPEKPLPEMPYHIKSILTPSPDVLERAEPALKKIKSVFTFKESISKKPSETSNYSFSNGKSNVENSKKDFEEFENDLKFDALDTVTDKITQVGSVNPIRDFQYLLSNRKLPFTKVCQQMEDVVFRYLEDTGNLKLFHAKILSMCNELRGASLKEKDATCYNSFMKTLRTKLLECDEELWNKLKMERMSLISKTELESSTVCSEESEAFLSGASSQNNKDSVKIEPPCDADEDYDNLLDEL